MEKVVKSERKIAWRNCKDETAEKAERILESKAEQMSRMFEEDGSVSQKWEELEGSIYDFALCFDWVDSVKKHAGYWRLQFTAGGPQVEIRFYDSAGAAEIYIEYVYLDWYEGIGYDISDCNWVKAYWEYMHDLN